DADTGLPVADADVGAYRDVGGQWVLGGYGLTDADGRFTVGSLLPGTYRLSMGGDRFFDQDRDTFIDIAAPSFTVTATTDVTGVELFTRIDDATPDYSRVGGEKPMFLTDHNGQRHMIWV